MHDRARNVRNKILRKLRMTAVAGAIITVFSIIRMTAAAVGRRGNAPFQDV